MPSGYWCDGVTSISFGGSARSSADGAIPFVVHRDRPGGQPDTFSTLRTPQ
jgi:hypothetical protein